MFLTYRGYDRHIQRDQEGCDHHSGQDTVELDAPEICRIRVFHLTFRIGVFRLCDSEHVLLLHQDQGSKTESRLYYLVKGLGLVL